MARASRFAAPGALAPPSIGHQDADHDPAQHVADREVRHRIVNALFSDEIPDPRDVMIVDLVVACAPLETLVHPRDVKTVRPRVEQLARMDLIGREVSRKIDELRFRSPA